MSDTGDPPRTLWDHCLLWADLLAKSAQPSPAAAPVDSRCRTGEKERPLLLVLLAAALHSKAAARRTGNAGDVDDMEAAARVALTGPGSAHAVLHFSPYATLQAAPDVVERGGGERARLLAAATSPELDERWLWHRTLGAAGEVLAQAAEETTPADAHGVPTISDAIAQARRARQLQLLQDVLGTED